MIYFSKHKYPFPFHDTLATMSRWRFVVVTVLGYSKSLLKNKIDFKVRTKSGN